MIFLVFLFNSFSPFYFQIFPFLLEEIKFCEESENYLLKQVLINQRGIWKTKVLKSTVFPLYPFLNSQTHALIVNEILKLNSYFIFKKKNHLIK